MGSTVDKRSEERLCLKFSGLYADQKTWDELAEQADHYAREEKLPFKTALRLIQRKPD